MNLRLIFSVAAIAVFVSLVWEVAALAQAGFVGLQVQGLDPKAAKALGLRSPNGVLVKDVAVGEPGAKSGIRRGDLITKFNKKTIRQFKDLLAAVGSTKPGQQVPVEVQRRGQTMKLTLKTTGRPAQWNIKKGAFHNYSDIGFTVASLTEKVREQLSIRWGATGLAVTLVDANSKVATGLKPGDVILQANLRDVWSPRQLTRHIEEARKLGRDSLLLLIEGPAGYRYSLLPLTK